VGVVCRDWVYVGREEQNLDKLEPIEERYVRLCGRVGKVDMRDM